MSDQNTEDIEDNINNEEEYYEDSKGDDNDNEQSESLDKEEDKLKKKRKRHYFEHHIRKILKEICPKRNITQVAKEVLSEIIIITSRKISDKSVFIMKSNSRKTITENDIESAIKLLFIGQLCQKSIEEGYKSLNNYLTCIKEQTLKGKSRNEKADILLPPSLLEKFLKKMDVHVSCNAPVFLAGVIEYFISQILELASNISLSSKNKNNVRITIYDIENGIRIDKELNHFFVNNNIYIHGAGITPYIHPNIKNNKKEMVIKSLKLIEKIQENTNHIFPKTCIDSKFKKNIGLIYPDSRYQKDCFEYFQDYLEKWIVEILQYTNNITLYSKKSRVSANDIELAMSIMERRQPSFLNFSNNNTCNFIKFDDKDEKEEL
jgi:histone H3/H4